jgi:iron(III) transport system ATP-binding protein
MNHIELDRVSKTFGERIVIDDVSLQIQKAERLVLFGPSGSGKTTVLRLIAGLEAPDKGQIRIEDRIVAGPEEMSFRQRSGILEWSFKISRSGLI